MPLTEYRFDPAFLSRRRVAHARKAKSRGTTLLAMLREAVVRKLARDARSYVEFGPYWWAVKRAMRPYHDYGHTDDAVLRAVYAGFDRRGEFDAERSLVAGWAFVELYAGTFPAGTRWFALDGQAGERDAPYGLFDPDVEFARREAVRKAEGAGAWRPIVPAAHAVH